MPFLTIFRSISLTCHIVSFILIISTVGLADECDGHLFSMGDSSLVIDHDGNTQVIRSNGEFIGKKIPGFILRYANGKDVYVTTFQTIDSKENNYLISYEDGSKARYYIESGNGFVIFRLEEIDAIQEIDECCLIRIDVPRRPIADWINTITLEDGFRIGLMTTSSNVLPNVDRRIQAFENKKGCSHSFKKMEQFANAADAESVSHIAEFCATSTLNDSTGWAVRGKNFENNLDLTGCVKLRARVYGDGLGEQLKIQLGGKNGHRDDYIPIDFVGWKVCELENPALNDLSYDDVRRLYFYYNSLPANKSVCCLIDWVEAVYLDNDGDEKVVVLEDFSHDQSLWDNSSQILNAKSFQRHKAYPASCALVSCSADNWSSTVQNVQSVSGSPSPRLAGGWRGESPYLHQSYFFLTWFTADEYENALAFAKRGGFKQILLLQNSWTSSTGHYHVNEKSFPGGVEQLRSIIEDFNKEGIRVGLHMLGASVDNNDPYIVPIPDKRFVTDSRATLAVDLPLSDNNADLLTLEDASSFPIGEDVYMGSGQIVRVDDELMEYSRREASGLYDCRRGVYGTHIAEHKRGTTVYHFTRAYGYHLPDLDTDFIDEIATNFAGLANQLPLDMLYFDGSELLQQPGSNGEHWYYNARLHKAFYDKLDNKDILFQASSCSPYSWHMIARNASADGHDDLKAYLEERSGSFDPTHNSESFLDVGWYYAYDKNSTPDMYEYCLGATIGYDASFSFQTAVSAAKTHPFIGEILDSIRAYENLRISHRFSDEFRQNFQINPALAGVKTVDERNTLWDMRKEYHLETDENGSPFFRRVFYPCWENVGSGKSDLGGTTMSDAIQEENVYVWNLTVSETSRVGLQVHFKNEDSVFDSDVVCDPCVKFYKVHGDKKEECGCIVANSKIHCGQFVFAMPDKTTAIYGLPLTESVITDVKTPDIYLEPGDYRVEFSVASGMKLPIRVRTPLYSDEILPVL